MVSTIFITDVVAPSLLNWSKVSTLLHTSLDYKGSLVITHLVTPCLTPTIVIALTPCLNPRPNPHPNHQVNHQALILCQKRTAPAAPQAALTARTPCCWGDLKASRDASMARRCRLEATPAAMRASSSSLSMRTNIVGTTWLTEI